MFKSMKKNISRWFLTVTLLSTVFVISGCKQAKPAANTNNAMMEKKTDEVMVQQKKEDVMVKDVNEPAMTPPPVGAKVFNVSAANFSFDVKEIKVKKGDTVVINFKNTEGFHDWVIDEFNTRAKQLKEGESATVTFVPDKAGTFEYYCSVGQHRKFGMLGKLIVE